MTNSSSPAVRGKGRRIGKTVLFLFIGFLVLVTIGFFVATSSAFFKGVILPATGRAMNSDIRVADASVHAFSGIVLTKLEIQPHGKEMLLKANEARVRYNLRDILGGKITVDEVAIVSPMVTIVQAADGSSNLDPIKNSSGKKSGNDNSKSKSRSSPNLNIKNISLKNALLRQTKKLPDGGQETTELANVNVSLDQLKNGEPGKLTLFAEMRVDRAPAISVKNSPPSSFTAILAGEFKYKLTARALPESAQGNLSLNVFKPALKAQLQFDGSMQKEVFTFRQLQVTLSPTARAKNQLNVTGQIDLSDPNAMKGNLALQSDSFDVTPFYDLYHGAPEKIAAGKNQPVATAPTSHKIDGEPEAMHLPIGKLLAEINIGQFYLRDIEIKDWRGSAKFEGSRVSLSPFQLSLNGAPVILQSDLNLGVKGYAYNFVASLNGVALGPLADFFMPEKKGAYQGTIIADANLKGAGTTGINLKKSLGGTLNFTFTNANIQIVDPKYKNILTPIALLLQIPEISESPINVVEAHVNIADGIINLTNFVAVSQSYRGSVRGTVPIADVLTNSPLNKIPVDFELRKSLATKAPRELGLASGGTSEDGQYVKLPSLIRLAGTLGNPHSEFDKKGLGALAIQAGAGIIGGDVGKALQGVRGALRGPNTSTDGNTNSTTNLNSAPATNQPTKIDNVLDLFKKKKKK